MAFLKQGEERNTNWATEIIEIGAVLLDENYDVIDSYKSYVKPDIGIIDN